MSVDKNSDDYRAGYLAGFRVAENATLDFAKGMTSSMGDVLFAGGVVRSYEKGLLLLFHGIRDKLKL